MSCQLSKILKCQLTYDGGNIPVLGMVELICLLLGCLVGEKVLSSYFGQISMQRNGFC